MEKVGYPMFEKLIDPGPRLSWIKNWLITDVWSSERYRNSSRNDFLHRGEDEVNRIEAVISSAAGRVYDELLSPPEAAKQILSVLSDSDSAVVIFDGLSVREIPIILSFAEKSGLRISNIDVSRAAIPSETIDFIERELPCGRIAPSQLQGRKELKEKGISAIHHQNYALPLSGGYNGEALLLWCSFPDVTYKDSGAKFENHFENIHLRFETAWINTVQQIKGKKKIVVTSDHGYIFFGTGMDVPTTADQRELNDYFGNDRTVSLHEKPSPPQGDDVFVDSQRNVAMIRGRVKTKSTGEAASRLYKHGGLSLMEMITPWIELETGL